MVDNWPLWVCLFLSGVMIAAPWYVWRRRHRIVSERLTWLMTAIGVAVVLGWLSVIEPERAWVMWIGFVVGGLPAVALGMWSVIEFMLESARHE